VGKHTTKDKPKEKFDGVVPKKSTVTTTTTSTIRQPLKAVTGGVPQSRKAVISVSEQVQQLEQIQEDVPAISDPMAIDPPHRVKAEILLSGSSRNVVRRLVYRRGRGSWRAFYRGRSGSIPSGPPHLKRTQTSTSGTTSTRKTLTILPRSASTGRNLLLPQSDRGWWFEYHTYYLPQLPQKTTMPSRKGCCSKPGMSCMGLSVQNTLPHPLSLLSPGTWWSPDDPRMNRSSPRPW